MKENSLLEKDKKFLEIQDEMTKLLSEYTTERNLQIVQSNSESEQKQQQQTHSYSDLQNHLIG